MCEQTSFMWKIDNYDMCPRLNAGATISSPLLSIGNPRHSICHLQLSSFNKEFLTCKCIIRNGSIPKVFSCKLKVLDYYNNYLNFAPSHNISLVFSFHVGVKYLPRGTLTLVWDLTIVSVPPQEVADLTEESRTFREMYERKEFSDITLSTRDKEFPLHKYLLKKRVPKFFEGIGCENIIDGKVNVENMSSPVLEAIIQYVYSGKMGSIPDKYLPEFYEVTKKYELVEFGPSTLHVTPFSVIITQVKIARRRSYFHFDANTALSLGHSFHKCINFENARFLMKLSFEEANSGLVWMHCTIQCLSALREEILLSYKITSILASYSECGKVRFCTGRETHHLVKWYCIKRRQRTSLQVDLTVSKGEHVLSVDFMNFIFPEDSVLGMGLLRHDIRTLYFDIQPKNKCPGVGDVTLRFKDGTISAHRAILAAWSPVFRNMFLTDMIEKNTGEANIVDFDSDTGWRFLRFLYSGDITSGQYSKDVLLYTMADKYQVTSLFRKCSDFLKDHVTNKTACEILQLANRHSDASLTVKVQGHIGKNRHILNSYEWRIFRESNPNLALRIEMEIRNHRYPNAPFMTS